MEIKFHEIWDAFINEVVPQQLFHIEETDVDEASGLPLARVTLDGLLESSPDALMYRDKDWFYEKFLTKNEIECTG